MSLQSRDIVLVDTFAEKIFYGNPCNVIFDSDDLEESTRLAISRNYNLSETAFICSSDRADFGARYYTHVAEIPLAGHPTVATALALKKLNKLVSDKFTLEVGAGVINVQVSQYNEVTLEQLPPSFHNTYDQAEVMRLLGLEVSDCLEDCAIQTVSTGTPQLMVPVKSEEVLNRLKLRLEEYAKFAENKDFKGGPHIFALTSKQETIARHPCTPPNSNEDPFTGSSTGGMAAYLWKYKLIEQPFITAKQGKWLQRECLGTAQIEGEPGNPTSVRVTGKGKVISVGKLMC